MHGSILENPILALTNSVKVKQIAVEKLFGIVNVCLRNSHDYVGFIKEHTFLHKPHNSSCTTAKYESVLMRSYEFCNFKCCRAIAAPLNVISYITRRTSNKNIHHMLLSIIHVYKTN